MIFRTITDDVTGANKSIGLFGLSIKNVSEKLGEVQRRGLKNVLFNTSKIDTNLINQYNKAILAGRDAQEFLASASKNTTKETIALIQSANGAKISEESLAAAQEASTLAARAQSAALKALSVAMNIGLSIAIYAVVSAITSSINKQEEARQKAKEAAEEANTLGDEIAELANKYILLSEAVKTDASAKEDLMTTQTELLKKLGLEGESIDDLIAKYGSLSNAIKQASIDSLRDAQIDLIAGVNATRKELLKVGSDGFWAGNNIINATGDNAVKAFKELEKAGVIDSASFGTGGGALVLTGDDTTVGGILENYQRLESALETLRDSNAFTAEELSNNSLYQAIYKRYSEMKDKVVAYNSSIANLNENLAQQTMLTALQGNEIPQTAEEFEVFKQKLTDTAVASNQFIGTEEEIVNAINSYLSTVPEFISYYSIPLEKELDKQESILKKLSAWQSSLYSPDQTYSDLIKDWESQTKQLQSVLSDIRSGDTAMTAADIVSQFPDLQPYIEQYEDLALAVDTFMRDSYEELLDKFGDTSNIEGFSYELEYLQGVLNEGLGGANNIDHLVSTYEELIGILDQVNSDHTFTEEEIANLINKYDALKDAVIITTDGYKLEDDALIDLINNYISLSNTAISNQIELTQTTIDGIEARVKAWGMEIEALKTVAKIYNATGGSKDAVGQYIYDNYGTNLTSATPAIIAAATEYAAASDQLDGLLEQLNNSYAAGSKYKSNGSSSSAAESFTDTLEKELAALDKSMEAGYINFNDYITARLGLIEEYYRKGRIAADEYYSYLEKHYDQQLSAMDRVVNAVTRRIDTEIDGLEKQKDSIESVYNAQIDSLEKQKTLLQEANKERERQADLQKALYELERAQQQKTKMVFTEDGGMRYVTDDTAIRDAGKNVDDARLEIQIAELDKSISKLEEARDRETAAIDETISKLKEYKDSWSDLTSVYEEEQDNLLAAQILGQEWEEDILNGRLDTLDAFKNQYISIQQAMADAAWQSANEQIKAAQEAQKGASGTTSGGTPIADTVTSPGPHTSLGNKSNIKYVAFHEYASGTDNAKKGINLVGEDGTEAYFDNHGHIALITEPTLIPMEGGEVVKNESATRKLLNPNNLAAVDTSTLAGIDSSDPIASGRLRPVQSGDRAWELQQSLIAYLAKIGSDINALVTPVNAIQRDTEQIAGTNVNTNQIHNANQMQQVTIGDIHVTCPGVTSQEIMNQVGEALNRQLGGIALDALQESTKR